MEFTKRLIAPSKDNKYYYSKDNPFFRDGYGMPNCTAYTWGRWFELFNTKPKLSINQAEIWYLKDDGYKRGNTPKLGAVACWKKGEDNNTRDGNGHVALVEEIKDDGIITTSNSAWGGSEFYIKSLKPPYNLGSDYTFQGFIYPPVEFDKVKYNLTRLLYKGLKGNDVLQLQKRLNKLKITDSKGRKLAEDKIFGPKTDAATRKFQKSASIAVDGKVGPDTSHKLNWLYKGK